MKIAYVITRSDAIGGAQIHVRDLAESLIAAGHDPFVLTGGEGPFVTDLRRRDIPVRPLRHLVSALSPHNDALAARELYAILGDTKPTLVACHSSKAGWLGRAVAHRLRIPSVFTAHGWAFTDGVPGPKRTVYRLAERVASPWAARIITVSDYDRNLALRNRIAPAWKISTVHNGVPDVAPEFRATVAERRPRIVMVARFERPKDFDSLITALAGLRDLDWELSLVGDGPLRPRIEALVREQGLAERVVFHGFQPNVASYLANSHLFALTSEWEGFPLSVLEAMRAGLPVVASNVGGVSEAVSDSLTGYVIPRKEINVLRSRLAELLRSPEKRLAMGEAGRKQYEQRFTLKRMVHDTIAVYNDVTIMNRVGP